MELTWERMEELLDAEARFKIIKRHVETAEYINDNIIRAVCDVEKKKESKIEEIDI